MFTAIPGSSIAEVYVRTLRELAVRDPRLSAAWLDELLARARAQADQLEHLRVRAAEHLFEAGTEPDAEPH